MEKETEFEPASVRDYEVEELICHILDLDEDDENLDIEEAIYEKFDCSFETFHEIVEHLLPLANLAKSPITDEYFRGFSVDLGEGQGMWLIKEEI